MQLPPLPKEKKRKKKIKSEKHSASCTVYVTVIAVEYIYNNVHQILFSTKKLRLGWLKCRGASYMTENM